MSGGPRGTPPLDLRAVEAQLRTFAETPFSQDVRALLAHVRALRAALVRSNAPYLAILLDGESRKWIAPSIWKEMETSTQEAAAMLAAAQDGPA